MWLDNKGIATLRNMKAVQGVHNDKVDCRVTKKRILIKEVLFCVLWSRHRLSCAIAINNGQ